MPQFTPLTGSCHCGHTRYVIQVDLNPPALDTPAQGVQQLYRCNCTVCHKTGVMHIRVPDSPSQFALLSPLSPFDELGDYRCNEGDIHSFFCRSCGVRCFNFMGEGEQVEVNVADLGLDEEQAARMKLEKKEDGKVKIFRPKSEGWRETFKETDTKRPPSYLSVNAHSIDAWQGLDLVALTKANKVAYYDFIMFPGMDRVQPARFGEPYPNGAY